MPVTAMRAIVCACVLGSSASMACASLVSIASPDYDRWNYPFSPGGTTTTASTFSDGGFAMFFDLRDGQFSNTYLTNDDIAAGQGVGNYQVTSAIVRARIADPNGYVLGGTGGTSPLELWSTGFRNGFNAFSYDNAAPFGPDQFTPGTRNAFAADALGNDVSNDAMATPLAIGTIAGKGAGDAAAAGDVVEFLLNIADPQVQAMLAGGLNDGALSFSITCLEAADATGGGAYPRFATSENTAFMATSVDLEVIPAPGVMGVFGIAGVAVVRRRR